MRARAAIMAATLVATLPGAASAGVLPRPDFSATAGRTFGANGSPAGGGVSLAGAFLWPALPRLAVGVHVFADDIGQDVGRLLDPNDGTDLGAVSERHRWTYGAAWRGDVALLAAGRPWAADASMTWGYYRFEEDVRGSTRDAVSAVGVSLGLTARRRVGTGQSLGLAVRGHALSIGDQPGADRTSRYASLALEWRWRGESDHE